MSLTGFPWSSSARPTSRATIEPGATLPLPFFAAQIVPHGMAHVHLGRSQRQRQEVRVDAANDLGRGENRLTGGTGVHSAALVAGSPEQDPGDDRLVLFARLIQRLQRAGFPRDLAPDV